MENFDKDSRAGYCYMVGQIVENICRYFETSPDWLKTHPVEAPRVVPEPVLDLLGVLMSLQGFLLEENDGRAAYLLHRILEETGPVVLEALGVSPAITRQATEVLN